MNVTVDQECSRYKSVNEARQELKDLIQRNKSMLQGARQREFQIIHEEIQHREEKAQKFKSSGGACSYKMPKIKVEARDTT